MSVRVLIVSPDTGFGGLIQQTLEKSGRFEPVMVSTGRQALEVAKQIPLDLAILDEDTGDLKFSELGTALLSISSGTRILLIPSDEPDMPHPAGKIRVNGYLTKPFYLPDLVDIVDSALTDVESIEPEQDQWAGIEDIQASDRASAEPAAPAQGYQNQDLESIPFPGNNTLAAQHLARLTMSTSAQASLVLRHKQLWAYAGQLSQEAAQELAQLVLRGTSPDLVSDRGSAERDIDLARFIHLESTGKEHLLYATSLEDNMLLVLAFDARTPFSEIRNQAKNLAAALAALSDDELLDSQGLQDFTSEPQMDEPGTQHTEGIDAASDDEMGWALEFDSSKNIESIPESVEYDQDSTQPVQVNQKLDVSTPTGPTTLYDLHYACILVPRLPDHYLIGDLSTCLSQWMRRLSLSFGWRLEYLALRPHWMQWIAGVEPNTSAEYVIQQIRTSTSDLIFAEFPRFAAENPSSDFWAPGYLVMTSPKPLPGEIVKEFTERTRLSQGIPGEG